MQYAGSRLPVHDDATRDALSAYGRRVAVAERRHLARLESLRPVELPWASTPTADHVARFAALLGVLTLTLAALRERLAADDPDRGDVPGWVMLTLMSAVLVAGPLFPLFAVIGLIYKRRADALDESFRDVIGDE